MKKIITSISISFVFAIASSFAQKGSGVDLKKLTKSERTELETAEFFYNEQNYLRALPVYVNLMGTHPDETYFKLKSGICFLYKSDEKHRAVELLEDIQKNAPTTTDIDFYLGRAYHLNYKFEEAIAEFNKYLATNPPIEQRLLTGRYIENSKNAKVYVGLKVKCDIENLGNVINTENNEYVPVISSDESVLIYTYTGPRSTGGLMDEEFNPDPDGNYYEDIFISHRLGEQWLPSESIGANISADHIF